MSNMLSISIDLQKHVNDGLLHFHASRPTLNGLEMYLVTIYKQIRKIKPRVVILDQITNLITVGSVSDVKSMLIRLIDFLQEEQIIVMFTALTLNTVVDEQTDEGVSSLVDAWLKVRDIECYGERNRGMYIMKYRGMKHSNQVREFVISNEGLDLINVYLGPEGVLTGSAREAHQMNEATTKVIYNHILSRKDRELDRKRKALEVKIATLQSEFESIEEDLNRVYVEEKPVKEAS